MTPLSNLLSILINLRYSTYLITCGEICQNISLSKRLAIVYQSRHFFISKIINFISIQLFYCAILLKLNEVKVVIFFLDGETLLLPVLFSKILRKKTLVIMSSYLEGTIKHQNDYLTTLLVTQKKISLWLANYIGVYSTSLIDKWKLNRYHKKIVIMTEHIVNIKHFCIMRSVADRPPTIGFVGRLSSEKGIMTFVRAANLVLKNNRNISFKIIGDGTLKNDVSRYIEKNAIGDSVKLLGWISHESLPSYYNDFKLLVIPSFSEGLPNVMLEAMACGTPILATPVGAIPAVIKNRLNGFLFYYDDYVILAEKMIELIKDEPLLNDVSLNARSFIINNYTNERIVSLWGTILRNINCY